MTQAVAPELQTVLEKLAREGRVQAWGVAVRVQQIDGSLVEGSFDSIRDSALCLFKQETQSTILVPTETMARLWLKEVVAKRRTIYLSFMALSGLVPIAVAALLPWKPMLAGVLMGTAVALAVMLAAWFPPVIDWMVVWQLRFPATDLSPSASPRSG